MAVYNLLNYLEKDGFGLPLNIRRGNPNPLDNSSVWKSFTDAQNYARTDPVAYVGQVLTVVNEVILNGKTIQSVTAYVIDNVAGDLKEIGSTPTCDNKTISTSVDGILSLYGTENLVTEREVVKNGETIIEKITYQPIFADGELKWIEPNTTTVEGLVTELSTIKETVNNIKDNAIETFTIDGVIQDIIDKTINIPMATNEQLGVVRGSTDENKIFINEDGTMEVSNINISKIIQDDNTTFILSGGSSV